MQRLLVPAFAVLVAGQPQIEAQAPDTHKISDRLWELVQGAPAPVIGPPVMTASGPQTTVLQSAVVPAADGLVVVTAIAEDDPHALAAELSALGATDAAVAGRLVSARLPVTAIPSLAGLAHLRFARPSLAIANAGLAMTQGCRAQASDVARAVYHVSGAGVRVGILSDSFNALGSMAASQASDDLPQDIRILADVALAEGLGVKDEGRAMGEIVHDVAPSASLAFHSAWRGEAHFANGIRALRDTGCRVIVDDVIYLEEPMFADGIIAQAVDEVAASGVAYFSSAGNAGRNSYEAPFRPAANGYHDFDPGTANDPILNVNLLLGTTYFILQWKDNYASAAPGNPGAQTDLDIHLVYPDGRVMPGFSGTNHNVGRDPVEVVGVTVSSGWMLAAGLRITLKSGPAPSLIKLLWYSERGMGQEQYHTFSSTLFGHMNARGAMAVGAARYCETPAFGQSPPMIEYFSSAGGTPIYYTPEGTPTYELRQKPEFVAPQGGNTTFFGSSDYCNITDAYPNFYGTSAAAPHAAAVAALMLEARPATTPQRLCALLEATAIDMKGPGLDFDSGYGLIQADAACEQLTLPPPVLQSVVSRRTHGTKGTYDIPLSLSSPATTEPRLQGPQNLVFTFDVPIHSGTAAIRSGTASITSAAVSGNQFSVQLADVENLQWLTVELQDVQGVDGGYLPSASVTVGCVEGDVNLDRMASTLDVYLTRQVAGAVANATNFRRDINADGLLSTLDVYLVRARAGNFLH